MGNNYSSNAKQSYFKLLNKTLKKIKIKIALIKII